MWRRLRWYWTTKSPFPPPASPPMTKPHTEWRFILSLVLAFTLGMITQ